MSIKPKNQENKDPRESKYKNRSKPRFEGSP